MSRSVRQLLTRVERLEVLYRISNIVNTTLEPREVLRLLLEEVVRITNATSGSIAMVDHRHGILNIETAINIPPKQWKALKLQLGVGVTGHCAYSGESIRVDDVEHDPHYVRIKSGIRSEMALPMITNERVIGVINVDSTRRGAFSQEDEELCMAVANQSAKVIETARLHDAVRRHAEEMDSLFTVGRTLIMPGPLEQILNRIVEEGLSLLNGRSCVLLEREEKTGELHPRAVSGGQTEYMRKVHKELGNEVLSRVMKNSKPVQLMDLRKGKRSQVRETVERERLISVAAVPVTYQERVLAVLAVYRDEPRKHRDSELRLLQLLANQGALAIENARRMERVAALEDKLRQSERFSLLGTLAAEIAHEIRNPITIINLLMHSIEKSPGHSEQTKADLQTITQKLERINQIVEQTLNFAKTSETKMQPAGLNQLVDEMALFMNYKFEKAHVKFRPELDPKIPEIPMDAGQIQQVLMNLFVNAIEAMPEGGELRVKTKLARDRKLGRCVRCFVEDTGVGMNKETLDHLFDPFYTTREGGTGLGLFISNKLVKRHQGTIKVKSTPEKGSCFTVTLPISQEEEEKPR